MSLSVYALHLRDLTSFKSDRVFRGTKATDDPVLVKMLSSGVVKPPKEGDDDRAPRAAG